MQNFFTAWKSNMGVGSGGHLPNFLENVIGFGQKNLPTVALSGVLWKNWTVCSTIALFLPPQILPTIQSRHFQYEYDRKVPKQQLFCFIIHQPEGGVAEQVLSKPCPSHKISATSIKLWGPFHIFSYACISKLYTGDSVSQSITQSFELAYLSGSRACSLLTWTFTLRFNLQFDDHLVFNEDVIFSVSEGRLRPGGDEEVVQADTVMYSNNIAVAKEVEMLELKFSVSPFLVVICFNVGQAVLLAIWRTSANCLLFPHPGVSSLRCGGRKGI